MSSITIENDGQLISRTNYWDLAVEEAGKVWVSVNAGAIRILVPRAMHRIIAEMRTGTHCVLSRGPWQAMRLREAVEIMFDDGSESPFTLHLSPESFDLLPAEPPIDREWVVTVWEEKNGHPSKAIELVCHWRRVANLPCMKPWSK